MNEWLTFSFGIEQTHLNAYFVCVFVYVYVFASIQHTHKYDEVS